MSEAQGKRIKALIADLAKLDSPDFGLSDTMSGYAFAPIADQSRIEGGLITDHRIKQSETIKELVALGPDSLTFLLNALDDKTPTKLVIEHNGFVGSMEHTSSLQSINPVNPSESQVFQKRFGVASERPDRKWNENRMTSYTVTIGDVCFVAVGQIVGREYQAVRYFPTSNIYLSSPTHDSKLCADVRTMWRSQEPSKKLFESLLVDYSTRDDPEADEEARGLSHATRLQSNAALRLLYYFPEESAGLIASRLQKMDIAGNLGATKANDERDVRRSEINGLYAEDFIHAVSWCKEPAIQASLLSIFKSTTDRDILIATLDSVDDKELLQDRLKSVIEKFPSDARNATYDAETLINAVAKRNPQAVYPALQRFLNEVHNDYKATLDFLLDWELDRPWGPAVLRHLLDDKRELKWTYPVVKAKEPKRPMRICDVVAELLAGIHTELKFELAGTHADLDKQIAVMKEQLKKANPKK